MLLKVNEILIIPFLLFNNMCPDSVDIGQYMETGL